AEALLAAFAAYRRTPFVHRAWVGRGLELASRLGHEAPAPAGRLFTDLDRPFPVEMFHFSRLSARVNLSRMLPDRRSCVAALVPFEPAPLWEEGFLSYRHEC